MTEKYDYSVPLDEMPMRHMIETYDVKGWLEDNYETIRHALKLAEKVTGEPSEGMSQVCNQLSIVRATPGDKKYEPLQNMIFKAMIAQAQKELEPPQAGEEG